MPRAGGAACFRSTTSASGSRGSLTECDGACVDLQTNALHCGGCDSPCGSEEPCIDGGCACDARPSSYAVGVEPILVDNGTGMGCHSPMDGAEGLDLSAGAGYDALVGVPAVQCGARMLVEPGSPGSSYLYDKVLGVDLCSGTKTRRGYSHSAAPFAQVSTPDMIEHVAPEGRQVTSQGSPMHSSVHASPS